MSDFDDYPFSFPQNWGNHMFLKIFLHFWRKDTWDNLFSSFCNK